MLEGLYRVYDVFVLRLQRFNLFTLYKWLFMFTIYIYLLGVS